MSASVQPMPLQHKKKVTCPDTLRRAAQPKLAKQRLRVAELLRQRSCSCTALTRTRARRCGSAKQRLHPARGTSRCPELQNYRTTELHDCTFLCGRGEMWGEAQLDRGSLSSAFASTVCVSFSRTLTSSGAVLEGSRAQLSLFSLSRNGPTRNTRAFLAAHYTACS